MTRRRRKLVQVLVGVLGFILFFGGTALGHQADGLLAILGAVLFVLSLPMMLGTLLLDCPTREEYAEYHRWYESLSPSERADEDRLTEAYLDSF